MSTARQPCLVWHTPPWVRAVSRAADTSGNHCDCLPSAFASGFQCVAVSLRLEFTVTVLVKVSLWDSLKSIKQTFNFLSTAWAQGVGGIDIFHALACFSSPCSLSLGNKGKRTPSDSEFYFCSLSVRLFWLGLPLCVSLGNSLHLLRCLGLLKTRIRFGQPLWI